MQDITRRFVTIGAAISVGLIFSSQDAYAGSATWNLNPGTNNWNSSTNWTPNTIPNSTTDIATFATSNTTGISVTGTTSVSGMTFNAGASPFTITAAPNVVLNIRGAGLVNNSGIAQNFVAAVDGSGNNGFIEFLNSATAGSNAVFTNQGLSASGPNAGATYFRNTSSATTSTITNQAGTASGGHGGYTRFYDTATAASSNITNNGALFSADFGGVTYFVGSSTAANATITSKAGTVNGARGGVLNMQDNSSAGSAILNNQGASVSGATGGVIDFRDTSDAATSSITNSGASIAGSFNGGETSFITSSTANNAMIINNGGTVDSAGGGITLFRNSSSAGNATIVANGGVGNASGGYIGFFEDSSGGTSRIKLFGNGQLELSFHNAPGVTVGSIEGDGNAFLGAVNLSVGTNNLSTAFSGILQDGGANGGTGGSLTKTGTGTLILSGANTYTGGTSVTNGTLRVDPGGTLGAASGSLSLSAATGVTTLLDLRTDTTVGQLTNSLPTAGSGAINVTAGKTFTVNQAVDTTFAFPIASGGSLVKSGSGLLRLSGNNSYTGTSTVSAGTLVINGYSAAANGAVSVINGATLGGIGTIGGATTIGSLTSGGRISAGDGDGTTLPTTTIGTLSSAGSLTFVGSDLSSLATYVVNLGSGLNNSDDLVVSGNLNLNSGFDQIQFQGSPDALSYKLLSYSGTRTGTFDFVTNLPTGYQLQYNPGEIDLVQAVASVPEPATWLASALALALLIYSRLGRRRGGAFAGARLSGIN